MRYRKLGGTPLEVSEIGFGAWGIGKGWWGETRDDLSVRALHRAFDLGVNLIDTAFGYGDGHSERVIARAFREYGKRVAVATKVPIKIDEWPPRPGTPATWAFPVDWIIRHTEKSLANLETDCIDLQQLHIWRDEWLREEEWQNAVRRLKQDGKIRYFGVSLIDHAPETGLQLVRSGLVDAVQVIYNLFDPSPEEVLFPLCRQLEVGVLARVPLDEGGLSGTLTRETRFPRGTFPARYFKGDRLPETVERAERLKSLLRGEQDTLPRLALRFCLSHPAVSAVIPGMRRPEHVEQNCAVATEPPMTEAEREALRSHAWPRNFYE